MKLQSARILHFLLYIRLINLKCDFSFFKFSAELLIYSKSLRIINKRTGPFLYLTTSNEKKKKKNKIKNKFAAPIFNK